MILAHARLPSRVADEEVEIRVRPGRGYHVARRIHARPRAFVGTDAPMRRDDFDADLSRALDERPTDGVGVEPLCFGMVFQATTGKLAASWAMASNSAAHSLGRAFAWMTRGEPESVGQAGDSCIVIRPCRFQPVHNSQVRGGTTGAASFE